MRFNLKKKKKKRKERDDSHKSACLLHPAPLSLWKEDSELYPEMRRQGAWEWSSNRNFSWEITMLTLQQTPKLKLRWVVLACKIGKSLFVLMGWFSKCWSCRGSSSRRLVRNEPSWIPFQTNWIRNWGRDSVIDRDLVFQKIQEPLLCCEEYLHMFH